MVSNSGWVTVEAELAALLSTCADDLPRLAQDSEGAAQATRAKLAAEASHALLESELERVGLALTRAREDTEVLQRRLDRVPSLTTRLVSSTRENARLEKQAASAEIAAAKRVASAEARAAELGAANERLGEQLANEQQALELLSARHDSLKKQFQLQATAARTLEATYMQRSLQQGLQQRISELLQENADLKKKLQRASISSSSSDHQSMKSKKRVYQSSSSSSASASSSYSVRAKSKQRKKKRADRSGGGIADDSQSWKKKKKKKKKMRDQLDNCGHVRKRVKLVVHER